MELIVRELGITDSQMFRSCRYKWHLGGRNQLNLEPNRPMTALWLGTGIHTALEAYYGAKLRGQIVDPDEVFDDWALQWIEQIRREAVLDAEADEKLVETRELGLGMLRHYVRWAKDNDRFDVVAVEEPFELVILETSTHQYMQKGRVDLVIKDHEGYWLMEHKTTRLRRFDTHRLLLDEQVGAYIYAARKHLDLPIKGVVYNYLRKKLPVYPETLVSGEITKRKNIDTTTEVYMQAIIDHNLHPSDYTEQLDRLEELGNTFFNREKVFRTTKELKELMTRLIMVDLDMQAADINEAYYPSPNPIMCPMCQFFGVCISNAEGGDTEFVLRNNYSTRAKDAIEWVEELDVLGDLE